MTTTPDRVYVPSNDMTYEPTDDPARWQAVEYCNTDTCGHPAHAFDRPEPLRHFEETDYVHAHGIPAPAGHVRPYLCGHWNPVTGCGGCDPGAMEFVIDDRTRVVRPFDPERDLQR